MKANRAYELIHTRGNLRPARLAGDERLDTVEVVSIDDGEVQLFWELPARRALTVLRLLRTDLATLDAQEFIERWRAVDEDLS
ncbi:MAG TPA: hypothetical protein VKT31_03525 [Solirubrobacteraceae bacterium]|nr:hypothetical protein [Solirubrobacteraceae bacterium]